MRFEARFDIFALVMLPGISQGIFLICYFLNRNNRKKLSNLFSGFLLLTFVNLSFTLCPAPCALCSAPCALCPVPCALCPVLCALCPVPCALCPVPCALRPVPCALCPVPCALCPVPFCFAELRRVVNLAKPGFDTIA